ncbi:hypothetical protein EDB87DRAFT_1397693 [Lactarius vividus]|nr:hypothetical protein EDB87DRAFT_1397693 [Lactarius vividus]
MNGPLPKLVVTITYLPPQRKFFPAHRSPMPLLLSIFLCSLFTHVGISKPLCAGLCRRWPYRSRGITPADLVDFAFSTAWAVRT